MSVDVMVRGDPGSAGFEEITVGDDQPVFSGVETMGGHGRWSAEEGTVFQSMQRWRP